MTVCIAATCRDHEDRPALVLCTDVKGGSPLGSAQTFLKIRPVGHGWRCLTAGDEDDIIALTKLIKDKFDAISQIDETNIRPAAESALAEYKTRKADQYTSRKWGMTFDEFRKHRADFPAHQYDAAIAAIGQIPIIVDLILAGFDQHGLPMLVKMHGKDGVRLKENFTVAGEGEYLAESVLLDRSQRDENPMPSTVYCERPNA